MAIKFDKLQALLRNGFKKGITEYNLIFKQGFFGKYPSQNEKGKAINTKTLDALCYALDCEVSDIIEFVKE